MRGTKQLVLILLVMVTAVTLASGLAVAATITGNDNDNSIEGTNQDDTISGEGGRDTIKGLGGKDRVNGGAGADALYGGDKKGTEAGGNNFLGGDEGDDTLVGDASADEMRGGIDDDTLSGMGGSDNLDGGLGSDTLYGADEEQTVGGGEDTISGNEGDDIIVGGSGADKLYGNQGVDSLADGPEKDASVDNIYGGDGDDTISSVNITASRDVIDCGPGNDTVQADTLDQVSGDCENVEIIEIEEDALERDAESYAADYGVPLEEAVSRLELQDSVGELSADLETEEADTFAGLWIQHEPEYRIVARFTDDGENTIRPYVEGGPLEDIVELRPADATLAELVVAQAEADSFADEQGIPADSSIDVKGNRAELYVTDMASTASARQAPNAEFPEHAVIVEVEGLSEPSVGISGGLKLY